MPPQSGALYQSGAFLGPCRRQARLRPDFCAARPCPKTETFCDTDGQNRAKRDRKAYGSPILITSMNKNRKPKISKPNLLRSKNTSSGKRNGLDVVRSGYNEGCKSEGRNYVEWMAKMADFIRKPPDMPKGERDGRVSAVPAAVLKSEGWPSHWGLARHFAKHPGDLKRRVGPVRNHAIRRAGRAGAEHFRLPKPRRCHEARRVRVRGSFETCGRLRPSAGVAGPAALSGGKTPPTPFLLRNVLPNASGSPPTVRPNPDSNVRRHPPSLWPRNFPLHRRAPAGESRRPARTRPPRLQIF